METIAYCMIWVYFGIGLAVITGLVLAGALWLFDFKILPIIFNHFNLSKLLIEYAKERKSYLAIKDRFDVQEVEQLLKMRDEIREYHKRL